MDINWMCSWQVRTQKILSSFIKYSNKIRSSNLILFSGIVYNYIFLKQHSLHHRLLKISIISIRKIFFILRPCLFCRYHILNWSLTTRFAYNPRIKPNRNSNNVRITYLDYICWDKQTKHYLTINLM